MALLALAWCHATTACIKQCSTAEKANIQQQLVNLCLNTSTLDASVDGQRRMLIPAKLRDEIFIDYTDVVCQGAYDSLYIFPSVQMHDTFNKCRK